MKKVQLFVCAVLSLLFVAALSGCSVHQVKGDVTEQQHQRLKELEKKKEELLYLQQSRNFFWLKDSHKMSVRRAQVLEHIFEKTEKIRQSTKEHLFVFCYDKNMKFIARKVIATGNCCSVGYHAKDVFAFAKRARARRVVVGHNHPRGTLTPSVSDIRSTKSLLRAARRHKIALYDDVIVTKRSLCSLKMNNPDLWK